jgi:type IV pilus assembly protein PilM
MKTTKIPFFIQDKPLFGLDIGHGSIKVMQIHDAANGRSSKKRPSVVGYGFTTFDKEAMQDGIVTQPEVIAKATLELFKSQLVGDITTRRVAIAIPAYRTFTRSLRLPGLKPKELRSAVELEAEQYISIPLEELYLDYEIIRQVDEFLKRSSIRISNSPRYLVWSPC